MFNEFIQSAGGPPSSLVVENDSGGGGSAVSGVGGSSVGGGVRMPEDRSTTVANDAYAQLAGMTGR